MDLAAARVALFAGLAPAAEPSALEWPRRLLTGLGRGRGGAAARVRPGSRGARRLGRRERDLLPGEPPKTWFPQTHRKDRTFEVAFFAAEFALTDSLPVYAGGLGAVAGEFLKSASAVGVAVVGVGLLYRETSHQWLDDTGLQQESWEVLDFERLPIELAHDAMGRPVRVKVPLPGREVVAQVWTVLVGRNRLYLLDTDIRPNRRSDRRITARLYGGDQETRIQQELVLGIGGVRALAALGHEPEMAHLNEGHSAFAALERIRQVDVPRWVLLCRGPRWRRRPGCFSRRTPLWPPVTTTSRPSWPIGTSRRTPALLGIDLETLSALGRYRPDDPFDSFCPTVLALRLAGARNGVSRLHGAVTRDQWGGLWPRLPLNEVPIGHVTNGIHFKSWISTEIEELLDSRLGPSWKSTPGIPGLMEAAAGDRGRGAVGCKVPGTCPAHRVHPGPPQRAARPTRR